MTELLAQLEQQAQQAQLELQVQLVQQVHKAL